MSYPRATILRLRRCGPYGRRVRVERPDGAWEWADTEIGHRAAEVAARWCADTMNAPVVDLRDVGPLLKDEVPIVAAARASRSAGVALKPPHWCDLCLRPFSCRSAVDRHQLWEEHPDGRRLRCRNPETLGMVRRKLRGMVVWSWPRNGDGPPNDA